MLDKLLASPLLRNNSIDLGGHMASEAENQAFDLIHRIASHALNNCGRNVPEIVSEALEEISALSRYKGCHGNIVSEDRRKLFELD